jgi:membrane protease YdiL (CAAX protease family)
VLGAPVLEELVFRAGLQAWLMARLEADRRGAALANLLTALAFASAHIAVRPGLLAALTLLPALVVGALYQRTRRVRHCVALHTLFNALWFAIAATDFVPAFTHLWLP